jgi:gamma-glutamyltranspeptidase
LDAGRLAAAVQTVEAFGGAVVSGHPLATASGLDVLRRGGNAVDAAVTAAMVSAVVLPDMCGVGADMIALVHRGGGSPEAVLACGALPAGFDPALGPLADGPLAALPPAAPLGWDLLLRRFGTLAAGEAMEPAVRYAHDGFPAGFLLSLRARAHESRLARHPSSSVYLGLSPGRRLRQSRLAATLERMAERGVLDLYRGSLAEAFCAGVAANGGAIAAADLEATAAHPGPAVGVRFRGLDVWTAPPPSHGLALLQALRLKETREELEGRPLDVAETLRIVRFVMGWREERLGDRPFAPHELSSLVSREWAARALASMAGGGAGRMGGAGGETTFIGAADGRGGACALMQSVYTVFGSAFVEPNTGVLLNNRLAGFSFRPGSPNAPEAGKRPMHNMTPCIATSAGDLRLVFGTPGGYAQVQANLQFLDRRVCRGMTLYEAVHAPRWVFGTLSSADPDDAMSVEPGLLEEVAPLLGRHGIRCEPIHEPFGLSEADVRRWRTVGSLKAIERDPETGALFAVADHRRHGHAAGF